MQVTLKQSDIEKSLKDYITAQGIRTEGKDVQIVFTAGRRGTGVTAEIIIEDGIKPFTAEVLATAQSPVAILEGMNTMVEVVTNAPPTEDHSANEPGLVPAKSVSLFG